MRFKVSDIRVFVSRTSTGVRGIRLAKDDIVISACVLNGFNVDPDERSIYLKASRQGDNLFTELGEISKERFYELKKNEQFILTITEKGYGKRTSSYEYRTTGRGGRGANAIMLSSKNGYVVAAFPVEENDQIVLITDKGKLLRCPINKIRVAGRRTQGVIVLNIDKEETVVGVSPIKETEEE